MLILEIALVALFLAWCGLGIVVFWSFRGVTVLRPGRASEPLAAMPKVSIIVPARNEEERLPAALESFLNLDYPDYEVILVDDDSSDRTGLIAEEWLRRPESRGRLRVIHNRELPAGWTGKVHALALAARAATGEWILATDADVVFHPALLRLALGCAERQKVALLSLVPEFEPGSLADKIVLPLFSFLIGIVFPMRLVNDQDSPKALAAGAFILMRRGELETLGGYERLPKTVIEDVRLAELFKRNGRRIYLAATRGLFSTRTYKSWRQLWEGVSRSAFEGAGYSVAKIVSGAIVGVFANLLPGVTAVVRLLHDTQTARPLGDDPVLLLALAASAVSFLVYLPFVLYFRASPFYAFTLPISSVFYAGASLSSAWRSLAGDGVRWKGRHYRAS